MLFFRDLKLFWTVLHMMLFEQMLFFNQIADQNTCGAAGESKAAKKVLDASVASL